jgi:hypothetical protein
MASPAIIDSLFCIPKNTKVTQVTDCVPFAQDLSPQMKSSGVRGVVLAPCSCSHCQRDWHCSDRKSDEVRDAVKKDPEQLRGLSSYDPLRIGDSLRWIDDSVRAGELRGAYTQAESCVSGLDAARMYPLYGLCAKLRAPVVLEFASRQSWQHHRPEVEVVAADFPDLDILLATPLGTDSVSMIRLLQRFPRIAFLVSPQQLQADMLFCEYVEVQGRERVAFRGHPQSWTAAVETAEAISLSGAARQAYLFENGARLFGFPQAVEIQ